MAKVRLNAGFEGVSGSTGSAVFAQTMYGTVMKAKPRYRERSSPALEAQKQRFRLAVAAYRTLTMEQNRAWKAFAASPLNTNPETREPQGITAYNAFIGLATRFLAVSPTLPIPVLPPQFPFAGDALTFAFTGETGRIMVAASGANSANTATELFVCPLNFAAQSVRLQDYTSAAFVAFTPNMLSTVLELAPGWYGVASRFVERTTGLATYRVVGEPVRVL